MSDYAIYVLQRHLVSGANATPWEWIEGEEGGWYSLRLTSGKVGSAGWIPGYLPRENAVSQIDLAVDLDGGGDAEQLRTVTIQVADQMASGQSMDAWLQAQGMILAGAYVSIWSPAPTTFPVATEALWTGVVRSKRLTDTRLELMCETPSDSDPIGEIVSDSAIRPIIYGEAKRVLLPPPAGDAQEVAVETLAMARRVPDSVANNAIGSGVLGYSPIAAVNLHWRTGNDWVVRIHSGMRDSLGYFLEHFPAGVVTEPDWYCEIVEGKGKGTSRRLREGSTISWASGLIKLPDYRDFGCEKVNGSPGGMEDLLAAQWEQQNWVQFVLEYPFLDEDYDPIISPSWNTGNPATHPTYDDPKTTELVKIDIDKWNRPFSYAYESPLPDRSYVRIVRKPHRRALPITSSDTSDLALFVKSQDTWVRVQNAEEIYRVEDSSATLRLIPSVSSSEKWEIFSAINFDPNRFCLMNSPWETTVQNLEDLFGAGIDSGFGGTLESSYKTTANGPNVDWMPQWWPTSHFSLMLGCDYKDLSGWEKLWFCAKGSLADANTAPGCTLVTAAAIHSSAATEIYFGEVRPHSKTSRYDDHDYAKNLRSTVREYYFDGSSVDLFLNSIPPQRNGGGSPYGWRENALRCDLSNISQAACGVSVFFGAKRLYRDYPTTSLSISEITMELNNLAVMLSRSEDISDVYADLAGPDYTSNAWQSRINGAFPTFSGTALTSGIVSTDPILDHPHAIEDIFRRHVSTPWTSNPVDSAAIEQACVDLWTKTQSSGDMLLPASRPRLSFAITEAAPQVGDVCAQLCRDSNLVGSRTGSGKRTVKAFLARTLLEEQDATILESDLFRGSITEAPTTPLSKLCSAPLIRYAQQAGAPTKYAQILRPDAPAWQSSYTIGFPDDSTAQRAWEICHRGWLESGAAHAREIRMDTIPDDESLIATILQPRGTTFLDWLSRPKRILAPIVSMSHAAVQVPRGGRIKLHNWKYAPNGAWGTLRRTRPDLQADTASLELVMDLPA